MTMLHQSPSLPPADGEADDPYGWAKAFRDAAGVAAAPGASGLGPAASTLNHGWDDIIARASPQRFATQATQAKRDKRNG